MRIYKSSCAVLATVLLSLLPAEARPPFGDPYDSECGDGDFNSGFNTGWEAGYKQVKGDFSLPPLAPLPPLPSLGHNDFTGGYSAGFCVGAQAGRE